MIKLVLLVLNVDIFLNGIQPQHINKGEIDDEYFLMTLSALAEVPVLHHR